MDGRGQGFQERGPHSLPEGLRVIDRPWAVGASFPACATGFEVAQASDAVCPERGRSGFAPGGTGLVGGCS